MSENSNTEMRERHHGLAKRMFEKYVKTPNNDTIPNLEKKLRNSREEISELREIAERDELTKVLSRKLIEKYADNLVKQNKKFCLLFIDADKFKLVNDKYGHMAGDVVLKAIGGRIQSSISRDDGDKIGRIGGEEFLAVLTISDKTIAMRKAEEIRKLFEDNPIFAEFIKDDKPQRQEITQTLSIGVAIRKDNEDYLSLISRADKAMYFAKEGGRNRVVLSNE